MQLIVGVNAVERGRKKEGMMGQVMKGGLKAGFVLTY